MELDSEMASLEINEKKRRLSPSEASDSGVDKNANDEDDGGVSQVVLRRSGRKRLRQLCVEKRRVETKPKKFDFTKLRDIESYYLDKRVKRLPSSLETIYEEPKADEKGSTIMSIRKFKRCVNMNTADKFKIKKRTMKVKKLCGSKKLNLKKIPMGDLMKQLATLEETN